MATVESHHAVASATADVPLLGSKARRAHKLVGRVGSWQLVRTLGEGSLTRVYLARPADTDDGAAVYAVKTLRREWWSEPRAIDTMRREAWVGQRVSHPNVLPVLAAGVGAPPFYVVSPRLEGATAAQLLASGRRLPLSLALWIARQGAEGLAALFEATGMLHGDVKPANLIVGPDGHTTLIDLGFCQTPREARSWADRPVMGTLHYLAPERVTSATAIGPRSDLYSLGCTLYELIAGRPPFEGDAPASLLAQHREARPTPLAAAAPGAPPRVAAFVERLLAKDPLRRPSTPREAADELVGLEVESFGVR